MFRRHIQIEGEGGQPPLPDPTHNSDICTTTATQRGTRNVAEW